MNIFELQHLIQDLIFQQYFVSIQFNFISNIDGLRDYNQLIRNNVQDLPGIYIWENADNGEVLYIGMAGKVNQQGNLVNHSVKKRLQASRGKDPETNREILTNRFIRNMMTELNCTNLNIHIIHLQQRQIPGYAEAVLINAFYQFNGFLPKYNSAF
jgi:hypothetical protein